MHTTHAKSEVFLDTMKDSVVTKEYMNQNIGDTLKEMKNINRTEDNKRIATLNTSLDLGMINILCKENITPIENITARKATRLISLRKVSSPQSFSYLFVKIKRVNIPARNRVS